MVSLSEGRVPPSPLRALGEQGPGTFLAGGAGRGAVCKLIRRERTKWCVHGKLKESVVHGQRGELDGGQALVPPACPVCVAQRCHTGTEGRPGPGASRAPGSGGQSFQNMPITPQPEGRQPFPCPWYLGWGPPTPWSWPGARGFPLRVMPAASVGCPAQPPCPHGTCPGHRLCSRCLCSRRPLDVS